jgi:tetratricopeptide (TPR) repeat protein
MLSGWIGDIAGSELKFSIAMQLLCNYSLVEQVQETGSYVIHPVVHQWARHAQGKLFAIELSRLAVVAVSQAVPGSSTRGYAALQHRLLPHAQACSSQIVKREAIWRRVSKGGSDGNVDEEEERRAVLGAVHLLGDLYYDQGKLGEAEQMYQRALRGKEEALDSVRVQQYLPALNTLENMGDLYAKQAEIAKARAMYARALSRLNSMLGQSSGRCMNLAAKIDALPLPNQEEVQSRLSTVGEMSTPQHGRRKKSSGLSIRKLMKEAFQ